MAHLFDILALKFRQHAILFNQVTKNGGAAWLEKCSRLHPSQVDRFQAWGYSHGSRFIRNLIPR